MLADRPRQPALRPPGRQREQPEAPLHSSSPAERPRPCTRDCLFCPPPHTARELYTTLLVDCTAELPQSPLTTPPFDCNPGATSKLLVMEQTRALNALEPFLALSKSANSPRAAADLVTQATSAPNTYVFAELLQAPTIQALRDSPEHQGHLRLLEVFAWGTWQDYVGTSCSPHLRKPPHPLVLKQSLT